MDIEPVEPEVYCTCEEPSMYCQCGHTYNFHRAASLRFLCSNCGNEREIVGR